MRQVDRFSTKDTLCKGSLSLWELGLLSEFEGPNSGAHTAHAGSICSVCLRGHSSARGEKNGYKPRGIVANKLVAEKRSPMSKSREGLNNRWFLPMLVLACKKSKIQTLFSRYLCVFLPVSRHFGGKQAHWPYASMYFSPISRLLNAASKCSRLLFLAKPR